MLQVDTSPFFALLQISRVLTQVWLTAGMKNITHVVTLHRLQIQVPLGTAHLPLLASGLWNTVVAKTESPLSEEEHSPGVGCMLRRATQEPSGEDNFRWEGEIGGVEKEELEKIICYINTGSELQFVNGSVGSLVRCTLKMFEICYMKKAEIALLVLVSSR